MKLPKISKPITYGSLTDDEFDALMNQSVKSYADGLCTSDDDFKSEITKELGL